MKFIKQFVLSSALSLALSLSLFVLSGCGDNGAGGGGGNNNGGDGGSKFTDERDGKTYKKVTIGGAVWMAENLNYETSSDSWCYDDKPSNCTKYGRLYTWRTAIAACPVGWHLPMEKEWDDLVATAGGVNKAGSKLKSKKGWASYSDISSSDEYGFSALPGGQYNPYHYTAGGTFNHMDSASEWWTAKSRSSDLAWSMLMSYRGTFANGGNSNKRTGNSVRCVEGRGGPAVYDDPIVYGGQTYKTVKIGDKTWMAENLNVETADSWCYENSADNCAKYGRLYTWAAATTACPNGWHLPDGVEWRKLVEAVGGIISYDENDIAGMVLKSKDGWIDNKNGTDRFGFSALPGGNGNPTGGFGSVGYRGYWWTATKTDDGDLWYRYMSYDFEDVGRTTTKNEDTGYSVRCVNDD
jgi:uncharacterized protein (TIGR02145 family)